MFVVLYLWESGGEDGNTEWLTCAYVFAWLVRDCSGAISDCVRIKQLNG